MLVYGHFRKSRLLVEVLGVNMSALDNSKSNKSYSSLSFERNPSPPHWSGTACKHSPLFSHLSRSLIKFIGTDDG